MKIEIQLTAKVGVVLKVGSNELCRESRIFIITNSYCWIFNIDIRDT